MPPGARSVSIAPDGTVSADTEVIGTIGVVQFDNPRAMKSEANNLYSTEAAPAPAERTQVLQGMLEESNVNAVQ